MAKVTKEEVLKLARISQLAITQEEIEPLTQQINAVLGYAACVKEVAHKVPEHELQAVNIFRPDEAIPTDPQPILAQAPETESGYFVVPRILENN